MANDLTTEDPKSDITDGDGTDDAYTAQTARRTRMKDGMLPVIAVVGALSVSVVWTLSANDPYWRLFDDEPVPAPSYGVAQVSDSSLDPLATAPHRSPALAVANRIAATIHEPSVVLYPLAASLQPQLPQSLDGSYFTSPMDHAAPRTALAARAGIDAKTNVAVALAPMPLAAPVPTPYDPSSLLADVSMTTPEVAVFSPHRPHFAANESTEGVLALSHRDRIDVQRRLALAGFDPNGLDGVFGGQTRSAIRDFQAAWGFPETGYLEPATYADLNQRTEEAYQALRRQAAAAPRAAPKLAPEAPERRLTSAEPGKCARNANGRVVARQSLKCDLVGFSESFVSLGRTSIDDDGDDSGTRPQRQASSLDR